MKRRIAKKLLKRYKVLRNLSKAFYLLFKINGCPFIDTGEKVYICTDDGRVLVYLYRDGPMKLYKGKGFYVLHDCLKDYDPGVQEIITPNYANKEREQISLPIELEADKTTNKNN